MKKIYSPLFVVIALLSSLLFFTSCEEVVPSVGSVPITGEWECTEVPKHNTLFLIKGDIIRFIGENYTLFHPDNSKESGGYSISNNGEYLTLEPKGGGRYEFKLFYQGATSFKLMPLGQGEEYVFKKK